MVAVKLFVEEDKKEVENFDFLGSVRGRRWACDVATLLQCYWLVKGMVTNLGSAPDREHGFRTSIWFFFFKSLKKMITFKMKKLKNQLMISQVLPALWVHLSN